MSVLQSDILIRKSTIGASAGGAMSAVAVSGTPQNNLFENIGDATRIAGWQRNKKWFIFNNHATDTFLKPSFWFSKIPVADTVNQIGLGINDVADSDAAQGNMTAWSANAVVSLQGSGATSQHAFVVGLDNGGIPTREEVVLNGTTPVLSTTIFSVVYAVYLATTGAVIVTVKQGSGGTTRGTIAAGKIICWLWLTPLTSGDFLLPDVLAQTSLGFWENQSATPALSGFPRDGSNVSWQEN